MHPILFDLPFIDKPVRLFGLFIITAFYYSALWAQWRWACMQNPGFAADEKLKKLFKVLIWFLLGHRLIFSLVPGIDWTNRVLFVFGADALIGLYTWWVWRKALKAHGREEADFVFNLAFWLLITGFLGSRLVWIASTPSGRDTFVESPLRAILFVWDGGIVWYGGLLFAAAFGIWYLWYKKMKVMDLGDVLIVGVAFALFIGRWACLSAGDDYGKPTDVAWALAFPMIRDTQIPARLIDIPIHPTQLYMSLNGLILFLVTAFVLERRKFHGQVVYLSMMVYSVGRSIIELYRGDEGRGLYDIGGGIELSSSQLISIPVFAISLWLYLRGWLRATRENKAMAASGESPAE